jgi:hypothetical protein
VVALKLLAALGAAAALTPSHTLLHSHELWATIDVCATPKQRDTIGVRGSMPGDGRARDAMYMSFRLQYMSKTKGWVDVGNDASSGWELVGNGASPRQGGSSFSLKPTPHKPAVTLRGVVDFQWRHGKTVLLSAVEPTTVGHRSLAGAEPADYSAASCVIA